MLSQAKFPRIRPNARPPKGTARRPRSVTFVGILLVLYGLTLVCLVGLVALVLVQPDAIEIDQWTLRGVLAEISDFDVVLLGGQLLMGVFMTLGGIGVLQMRGWAWLMAIIALGVHLLILLINYWRGTPSYWEMLFSATMIFLVNLQEVHQTLGLVDDPTESTHPHEAWGEPADTHESRSLLSRRN
jgi:hypothetical protein